MKNFAFLEESFPSLANWGHLAEAYRQSDPNSALMKLGMIGESIVLMMFKYDQIPMPKENNAVNRINTLEKGSLLPRDVVEILHLLRKARNKATHEGWGDEETVSNFLPLVHSLAGWFAQVYGPLDLEIPTYTLASPIDESTEQREADESRLQQSDELKAEQAVPMNKRERVSRASWAANQRPHTEAETRLLIDKQLQDAGWEVDTKKLRYAQGTRPEASRNLAIAEWPTNSRVGKYGRADYALFIGEKLVALIEAKADSQDIPSVLDYQARDYAQQIKPEHYDRRFLVVVATRLVVD